jgi:hypothetical protein
MVNAATPCLLVYAHVAAIAMDSVSGSLSLDCLTL